MAKEGENWFSGVAPPDDQFYRAELAEKRAGPRMKPIQVTLCEHRVLWARIGFSRSISDQQHTAEHHRRTHEPSDRQIALRYMHQAEVVE